MRIYISGKITGLTKGEYYLNFVTAEKHLREEGHVPVNPIMLDGYDLDYEQYLAMDKILIESCHAIYMLRNWKDSLGARREKEYAEALGLKILFEEPTPFEYLSMAAQNCIANFKKVSQ